MHLIDLSHTSHTRARTGVQRVARSLAAALAGRAQAITFDPHQDGWRPLDAWERANLSADEPSAGRGARWPWPKRLLGRLRRLRGKKSGFIPGSPREPGPDGLIVPEIFSPATAAALPRLFAQVNGPRIALFHDAVALQLPELTPTKTVARFPAYLQELLSFDGIAAISEASRDVLVDYWRWLGVANPPPVEAVPLAIDPPRAATGEPSPSKTILCVASLEGRKNHLALLEACESLWTAGKDFELRLIGLSHPQTARPALDRIANLQAAGRPLRYDGPVDEATLASAYRACAFTVYPSLLEGFGLPVLESLSYGRPCICSARGALGEAAGGGGCLALDSVGGASLGRAIGRLLGNPSEIARLSEEARARRFKTWSEYAAELTAWMAGLARKSRG